MLHALEKNIAMSCFITLKVDYTKSNLRFANQMRGMTITAQNRRAAKAQRRSCTRSPLEPNFPNNGRFYATWYVIL